MADRVLFQTDDDVSEQNLTEQRSLSNLTDYVERGLGFNADFQANTLDVGSGHAIVRDGIQAYDVFPDARTGLGLASTTGTNYVYLTIRPGTQDDIRYEIESSQTPPSDPSLLVGTVDAGADTSTVMNRAPAGEFSSVSTDASILTLGSVPDNTDTPTHEITTSEGDIEDALRFNVSVGTSATTIATIVDTPVSTGLVQVVGYESGNTGNRFSDIVHYSRSSNTVQELIKADIAGAPDGRSYSSSDFDPALQLSMSSTTYTVGTRINEMLLDV